MGGGGSNPAGIPHYLLMENALGEMFALIPASLPLRPELSTELFCSSILMDRNRDDWMRDMGESRSYVYPVHLSHTFMFTPSLASMLYLMLLYFQVKKTI